MRIDIYYRMTAPVSHIGETASTGAYFNMIRYGSDRLPVITGNSIRGQIRDAGAAELLNRIGCMVDKETFHVLFSGGNVSGAMKDDVGRAKAVREAFPLLSMLGGALGTMIMAGKLICGFAYPVCKETRELIGCESDISWRELIDEIEFTRTDDAKNDKLAARITDVTAETTGTASQQMRYAVQYMAAGTQFVQKMQLLPGTTALEIGALLCAIRKWWEDAPRLGGMSGKGFGLFDADLTLDGREMLYVYDGSVTMTELAKRLIDDYMAATNGCAELLPLLTGESKSGKKIN